MDEEQLLLPAAPDATRPGARRAVLAVLAVLATAAVVARPGRRPSRTTRLDDMPPGAPHGSPLPPGNYQDSCSGCTANETLLFCNSCQCTGSDNSYGCYDHGGEVLNAMGKWDGITTTDAVPLAQPTTLMLASCNECEHFCTDIHNQNGQLVCYSYDFGRDVGGNFAESCMHCSVGDGELTCATCRTASKNVGPGPALGGIQVGPTSIALAGCTSFSNDDGKLKCDDPT